MCIWGTYGEQQDTRAGRLRTGRMRLHQVRRPYAGIRGQGYRHAHGRGLLDRCHGRVRAGAVPGCHHGCKAVRDEPERVLRGHDAVETSPRRRRRRRRGRGALEEGSIWLGEEVASATRDDGRGGHVPPAGVCCRHFTSSPPAGAVTGTSAHAPGSRGDAQTSSGYLSVGLCAEDTRPTKVAADE